MEIYFCVPPHDGPEANSLHQRGIASKQSSEAIVTGLFRKDGEVTLLFS